MVSQPNKGNSKNIVEVSVSFFDLNLNLKQIHCHTLGKEIEN